jgi:hypothetical protein
LTCLCPQDRFAVLRKPVCRKVRDPVDPSAHSFQPATLREPNQHGVLDSQSACQGRSEGKLLALRVFCTPALLLNFREDKPLPETNPPLCAWYVYDYIQERFPSI